MKSDAKEISAAVIAIIVERLNKRTKTKEKKMQIDFKDLVSRKEVIRVMTEMLENLPSAFAEEKRDPKGGHRFEDIESWEHEQGFRKWKDRHHL